MTDQEILNVPRYISGQKNGHITLGEHKNAVARGPQLVAESRTVNDPTGFTPSNGQAWVIGTSAVDVWAGLDGNVAMYYDEWFYRDLNDGEIFSVLDEGTGSPTRGRVYFNAAGTHVSIYTTP